ncbi:MAG: T9SS type A sorting domain-containing protein [Chitinophagaceae bacterium]
MRWNSSAFFTRHFSAVFFIFFFCSATAQPPVHTGRFSPFIDNNVNGFWEYLPRNYDADINQKYPLIVFIHGAGEQGSDQSMTTLNRVLRAGPPRIINNGTFPDSFYVAGQWHKFIVISPQIKDGILGATSTVQPSTIEAVIQYALSTYRVDATRIYLCGLSMGGGAAWDYAGSSLSAAQKLAGIVVAAGAADLSTTQASNIAEADLPVLSTHNRDDNVIGVSRTEANIFAIQSYTPAISLAPKAVYWDLGGHNVWRRTFEDILPGSTPNGNLRDTLSTDVYEWLLTNFRPSLVLPVSWQSFVVRSQNGKALLQWVVSNQANVREYIVEKSGNGVQWSTLATLNAIRGTNAQTYSYTDGNVAPGLTYYRIRQSDYDGKFSYSTIKTIDLNRPVKLLVYPNPFFNQIRIDANIPAGSVTIKLADATGKIVATQPQQSGLMHEIILDGLGRLASGTYYLSIEDAQGKKVYSTQVIKK